MKTIATTRPLDATHGAVRVEDVYDTDIEDLWDACTNPERLARWIAKVSGELREGGTVHTTFTSTWSAPVRIDVCEAPHHLVLTSEPGTPEEGRLEAWLTAEGPRTRLTIEDTGIPVEELHFHGAGWQVHLEDLGRSLASGGLVHPDGWSDQQASPQWHARWQELIPAYQSADA
ncbi:SRPBCC family protein [Flexivirga caeni]|uniref:SRPBCC family protein n=1 Tax=Flexivirga caeni TaxID=2294115 RepID=A0A3M9M7Y4_9MICO|nr:SRPBCC family protein [Flexivirga caeni]RNI21690.1 SRPBCC family protein [Flexivirga caeni]